MKAKVGIWTVLSAALLCFVACGKKDGATPPPELPVPGAANKVAAQAEVKASSGPVEISFLLHKTEIKRGDYLWHQIRLRNVGEKPLIVSAKVFREPWELAHASDSGYGVYLEALGPDGSKLKVQYPLPAHLESYSSEDVSGMLEVEGPEEKAMLDAWKKQGLSQIQIDRKLLDFNMQKRLAAESKRTMPAIKLMPGQSVETKSTFSYSAKDKTNGKSIPKPIGEFGQIDFFDLNAPGEYRVRAVYNHSPTKTSMQIDREFNHGPDPSEVFVHTPWISVKVIP